MGVTFIDEATGKHAQLDITAKMIHSTPTPKRVAKQLQGTPSRVGAKRGLFEHLIQIDFEGEANSWIYSHLPDKKNGFQKAVMAPIGAVDAEHGLGLAVTCADRPNNLATVPFVKGKHEDA